MLQNVKWLGDLRLLIHMLYDFPEVMIHLFIYFSGISAKGLHFISEQGRIVRLACLATIHTQSCYSSLQ
jgi:hypothetical protein